MLKLLILGLGLLSLTQAWKTYSGYRTYKVTPQTEEQVTILRQLLEEDIELDEWKPSRGVGHEAHVMVSPEKRLSFAETMARKGLALDVHVADVGEDVADLKARLDARRKPDGRMDFDLGGYNTVADTFDQLAAWAEICPSGVTCTVEDIGTSHLGVVTKMFTMSTGTGTENVYIDALTHARELLTGTTVNNMINKMVNDYESDADVTHLLDNYNWYFVPIMNPDGYDYAFSQDAMWRKNRQPNAGSGCIGTDLNRNFDTGAWARDGTSTSPCSETYGGASAASAPETQYVQDKLDELRPKIMISIHSYAKMWLQPYGHSVEFGSACAEMDGTKHRNMLDAGQAAIDAIMDVGGERWVRGTVCSVIYPASGGTVDYAEVSSGADYSYTPELRGSSFNPLPSQIIPAFEETWAGIVDLITEVESH